jgi:hypothetical protein
VTLLSIGDQVKPGAYRFHSRFNRAVNFVHRGRLIAVVDEAIGPGPLNIVLHDLNPNPNLNPNLPLQITPRTILFAGRRCHFTALHRYNSTLALESVNLLHFQHNLLTLGEILRTAAPAKSLAFLLDRNRRKNFRAGFERAFAQQITRGVRHIFHGRLLEGIRHLKGCGLGLTPAGDDFIAGLLIGLHLLQRFATADSPSPPREERAGERRPFSKPCKGNLCPASCGQDFQPVADAVFRAARGDNPFSNTFLDLARRGLLFGPMKDLLLALVSGSAGSVRGTARKLFAIGETSGADLATGLFLTVASGFAGQKAGGEPKDEKRQRVLMYSSGRRVARHNRLARFSRPG